MWEKSGETEDRNCSVLGHLKGTEGGFHEVRGGAVVQTRRKLKLEQGGTTVTDSDVLVRVCGLQVLQDSGSN